MTEIEPEDHGYRREPFPPRAVDTPALPEATREQLRRLRVVIGEFLADVEAHTIPGTEGRAFVAFAGVAAVSESFDVLAGTVVDTYDAVHAPHRKVIDTSPSGWWVSEGASYGDIGRAVASLLQSALSAVAWPVVRMHEEDVLLPDRPFEHQRFRWGGEVPARLLEILRSVARAIDRACPVAAELLNNPDVAQCTAVVVPPSVPDAASDVEHAPNVFRLKGAVWEVTFEGNSYAFENNKGLAYLAILLGRPNRATSVEFLETGKEAPIEESGPPQPVIDADAFAELRGRAEGLRASIESTRAAGDGEGAAEQAEELARVERVLTQAAGANGRTRSFRDAREVRRTRVAQCIRTALASIGRRSPELATYLKQTIQAPTGSSPRFSPRSGETWVVV